MRLELTPEEAMDRLNILMAHAWMVRTFLKHAEEIEDDAELLEVPRTLFDVARALEGPWERHDAAQYLRTMRKKLGKLRRAADRFRREVARVSSHTNFEQAARSLDGIVVQVEEVLNAVPSTPSPST